MFLLSTDSFAGHDYLGGIRCTSSSATSNSTPTGLLASLREGVTSPHRDSASILRSWLQMVPPRIRVSLPMTKPSQFLHLCDNLYD